MKNIRRTWGRAKGYGDECVPWEAQLGSVYFTTLSAPNERNTMITRSIVFGVTRKWNITLRIFRQIK